MDLKMVSNMVSKMAAFPLCIWAKNEKNGGKMGLGLGLEHKNIFFWFNIPILVGRSAKTT